MRKPVCMCTHTHTHSHTHTHTHTHMPEYYSATTKDEMMPFAATWMDPEVLTRNEMSE